MPSPSSKPFRDWNIKQTTFLPPCVEDFVPPGHPAHLIRDLVVYELDLSEIYAGYEGVRGQPPYDPRLMVSLLLFAYTQGIYSSRRIAQACERRMDFLAVVGLARPDFRTIALFRQRHRRALAGLFKQSLRVCAQAGLVRLEHVALDGTKVKANASKYKAMSYKRMEAAEEKWEEEIGAWFEQARQSDEEEDRRYGRSRGDELPQWVKDKQRRLERLREAKRELEEQAKRRDRELMERQAERKRPRGRPRRHALGQPKPDEQRNFVDGESRIMKSKEGFVQGYNAQAAVDAKRQVIVAQGVTPRADDQGQLQPMVKQIENNTGRRPKELSADAGYCSDANLGFLKDRGIRGYVATGSQRHPCAGLSQHKSSPHAQAMRRRLKRGARRSRYRLRKQVVEPVFGQVKQARGFRQFLTRGLHNVSMEWALLCTAHNLLKWARSQAPQAHFAPGSGKSCGRACANGGKDGKACWSSGYFLPFGRTLEAFS